MLSIDLFAGQSIPERHRKAFWRHAPPVIPTILAGNNRMNVRGGEAITARLDNGSYDRRKLVFPGDLWRDGFALNVSKVPAP